MKTIKSFLNRKLLLVSVFCFLIYFIFIFLGGLHTFYLYNTLYFGKWVEYRDENLGISYTYPLEISPGYKWEVANSGWTPIECDSDKQTLVGDKYQGSGIAICKSNPNEIQETLKNNRWLRNDFSLGGKTYIVFKTALEDKEGYLLGRVVISPSQNLIIGITSPPLGDNFRWIDHAEEKIKLRVITSIKPL